MQTERGPQGAHGTSGFATCRTALEELGVMSAAAQNAAAQTAQYEQLAFPMEMGQGWIDLYQINHGIVVGRTNYDLHPSSCLNGYMEGTPGYFSLSCMHSGAVSWQPQGTIGRERVTAETIFLCPSGASRKAMAYEWQDACPFHGVCILIPNALMHELIEEQGRIDPAKFIDGEAHSLMDRRQACHREIMQAARTLMRSPSSSVSGRLQMESLALDVVATLAGLTEQADAPA